MHYTRFGPHDARTPNARDLRVPQDPHGRARRDARLRRRAPPRGAASHPDRTAGGRLGRGRDVDHGTRAVHRHGPLDPDAQSRPAGEGGPAGRGRRRLAAQPDPPDRGEGPSAAGAGAAALGEGAAAPQAGVGRPSLRGRPEQPGPRHSNRVAILIFLAPSRAYTRQSPEETPMKYFIDTHDKSKGSFPADVLTEEQFYAQFDALEKAALELHAFG